jgi:serine/threonine protein kinase
MLLQQSPFRGEDEDEIYDAILADEPLYPIHMPRDSVSILQKLLTREPDQRLGSGPTDAQEIMSQPFFRNISWEDVYHKRLPPPFIPQITSATDTSNFDSEFTNVTPVLTPVQSGMCQNLENIFAPANQYVSPVTSHAGRIPWLLIFGRFRMREVILALAITKSVELTIHPPLREAKQEAYVERRGRKLRHTKRGYPYLMGALSIGKV